MNLVTLKTREPEALVRLCISVERLKTETYNPNIVAVSGKQEKKQK